jgi:hypothetical protein
LPAAKLPCQKRKSGQSLAELGVVGGLFVMISMLSLNIGLAALGSSSNERACRDAARAAAQGNNTDQAIRLAQASLLAHSADGYFVTRSTLSSSDFVYEDFGGDPPPNTSPYVQVTTTNQVRIPAPFLFPTGQTGSNGLITFRNTYTFPIVKVQLYL